MPRYILTNIHPPLGNEGPTRWAVVSSEVDDTVLQLRYAPEGATRKHTWEITLTRQENGMYRNANHVTYTVSKPRTGKRPYSIASREEGRGPATIRKFFTLAEAQEYVKARWQGVEYIDGPASFHSDYCTFDCTGFTLADLGHRLGEYGTDEYWYWDWKEITAKESK